MHLMSSVIIVGQLTFIGYHFMGMVVSSFNGYGYHHSSSITLFISVVLYCYGTLGCNGLKNIVYPAGKGR
jgi:hypothetical protein